MKECDMRRKVICTNIDWSDRYFTTSKLFTIRYLSQEHAERVRFCDNHNVSKLSSP